MMEDDASKSGGSSAFPNTQWTVIVDAVSGHPERAREALEGLCQAYRQPIVNWFKRNDFRQDPEDPAQGFLAYMLEKSLLTRASCGFVFIGGCSVVRCAFLVTEGGRSARASRVVRWQEAGSGTGGREKFGRRRSGVGGGGGMGRWDAVAFTAERREPAPVRRGWQTGKRASRA